MGIVGYGWFWTLVPIWGGIGFIALAAMTYAFWAPVAISPAPGTLIPDEVVE